jgi:hypothetical protein
MVPDLTASAPVDASPPKRQPRTKAATPAGAGTENAGSPVAEALLGELNALKEQVSGLNARLDAQNSALGNLLVAHADRTREILGAISTLGQTVMGVAQVQQLVLGLNALFCQEVLKAPSSEVLGPAAEEANILLEALNKAASGKGLAGPGRAPKPSTRLMSSTCQTPSRRSRPHS